MSYKTKTNLGSRGRTNIIGSIFTQRRIPLLQNSQFRYVRTLYLISRFPQILYLYLSYQSSTRFTGTRTSKDLNCDLKVTFRSDNLLNFFNYSMDKGILTYPLNPFLENVVNLGRTSISITSQQN